MNIIKLILSTLVLFIWFIPVQAEVPVWTADSHDFLYSMTLTGPINIDGIELSDPEVMIGAFVGEECRGTSTLTFSANRYNVFLTVFSNTNNEKIELRAYIPDNDNIVVLSNELYFEINATLGTVSHPYILSQPKLSSDPVITSMSFPEQDGETIFKNDSIFIPVFYGTSQIALSASFTTPVATKVYVDNALQVSGSSILDYSSALKFDVLSADETNWASYFVKLVQANARPTDINISNSLLEENTSPDSAIGFFSTVDADNDPHSYSLVSGTDSDDNALFYLKDSCLYSSISFDFETKKSYTIRLLSEDGDGGSFEKAFNINVTDQNEAPVIEDQSFNIDENSENESFIGTLIASDVDADQSLEYKILEGDPDNILELDFISGRISVKNSTLLDYELITGLNLSLMVYDNGNPVMSDTCMVYVAINDINAPPTDINISCFSVLENTSPDSLIGFFSTVDMDNNPPHSYSLVSGKGSNDNDLFYLIDSSLYAKSIFDFERKISYTIRLLSDDGVGGSLEKSFIINVIDQNEAPVIENQNFNIDENSENESFIGTLIASDVDADQSLEYKILEGDPDNILALDSVSGELSIKESILLDFESVPNFDLNLMVYDNGIPVMSDTCIVHIDVNDIIEGNIDCSNYISPNGDGINDFWIVKQEYLYQNCQFYIFDSHGNIMMEQTGYTNNWEGKYKGKELPEGAYYFVIKDDVYNFTYKGTITLVR